MSGSKHKQPPDVNAQPLGRGAGVAAAGLAVLGVALLAAGFALGVRFSDGMERFWHTYLVSGFFFLSLSLGALFFILLMHLTRSVWSPVVRRVAEFVAAALPALFVLFIPLLLNLPDVYEWTETSNVPPLLQLKRPFLNEDGFMLRVALYFAVWSALALWYYRVSLKQDGSGDQDLTRRMQRFSPVGMVLFAATSFLAGIDLLMTLQYEWVSTALPLYALSGAAVGFFALLILTAMALQATGRLRGAVTPEHFHDLGKYLFGFVFFWGYIAFSQYMLIWYGNIPEETRWYLPRQSGSWGVVFLVLIFGHLLLPFLGLVTRGLKRNRFVLGFWCVWLLAMHWVDIFWMVMPAYDARHVWFGPLDAAVFCGMGAVLTAAMLARMARRPLMPLKDPRLETSLRHKSTP